MKNKLGQYAQKKTSQYGEDGIIAKIFEILPRDGDRWCVEFGAWDGKNLSNTYELMTNHSWRGVMIEASSRKFQDLKKTYGSNDKAVLVNELVHFEGSGALDNILKKTPIPKNFDLLSIDIDGCDYYIWESMKEYAPKLVVIEFNPTIPSDVEFVQAKDFGVTQGNSLLALTKLGKQKGYELIATTVCNGFFVKKEYYHLFDIADNSVPQMWATEPVAPRIFQLFDGTLVLTDSFKLHWSRNTVGKYDLQKVPRFFRHFHDATGIKGTFYRVLRKVYYSVKGNK
ncbi:MAG: hypothetical protein WDO15_12040 [Bacteroidota bacterium]